MNAIVSGQVADVRIVGTNRGATRDEIMGMENFLRAQEGAIIGDSNTCPLKHSFSDGLYVREIFIPAGYFVIGKIHKHDHPNFLMSGTVNVITEFESMTLSGPLSLISKAGTKRALYAVTDLVWVTVHLNPTNTQDLKDLEEEIIAPSYEAYEQFILNNSNNKIS